MPLEVRHLTGVRVNGTEVSGRDKGVLYGVALYRITTLRNRREITATTSKKAAHLKIRIAMGREVLHTKKHPSIKTTIPIPTMGITSIWKTRLPTAREIFHLLTPPIQPGILSSTLTNCSIPVLLVNCTSFSPFMPTIR